MARAPVISQWLIGMAGRLFYVTVEDKYTASEGADRSRRQLIKAYCIEIKIQYLHLRFFFFCLSVSSAFHLCKQCNVLNVEF